MIIIPSGIRSAAKDLFDCGDIPRDFHDLLKSSLPEEAKIWVASKILPERLLRAFTYKFTVTMLNRLDIVSGEFITKAFYFDFNPYLNVNALKEFKEFRYQHRKSDLVSYIDLCICTLHPDSRVVYHQASKLFDSESTFVRMIYDYCGLS